MMEMVMSEYNVVRCGTHFFDKYKNDSFEELMEQLQEGYFNDKQSDNNDIIKDVESDNMSSDYVKYNFQFDCGIRINSEMFKTDETLSRFLKMFEAKCKMDLDSFNFIEDIGDITYEEFDDNGIWNTSLDHTKNMVFGDISIKCKPEVYNDRDHAWKNLRDIWAYIPVRMDLSKPKNIYKLMKYFSTACPFYKRCGSFYCKIKIVDAKEQVNLAEIMCPTDTYQHDYDFNHWSTICEDLYDLCQKLISHKYKYGDMLRSLHTTDVECIMKNHYFDWDFCDYDTLDDNVHYIGHFNRLGNVSNKDSYAYKLNKPRCSSAPLFTKFGEHDSTAAMNFDDAYNKGGRLSWIKDYVMNNSFSAYFVNSSRENGGITEDLVVLVFDGMCVGPDGKEYTICLEGCDNYGYVGGAMLDLLSCFLPVATAQNVIDDYSKYRSENEDDEEDDEYLD